MAVPPTELDIQTDRARRSHFLRILNRAWLGMGILSISLLPFLPGDWLLIAAISLTTFSTYYAVRWLNKKGRVRLGGVIFSLAVDIGFLIFFLVMVYYMGAQEALDTQSPMLMMMALAILFAGALVEARAALILAAINSVILVVIVLAIDPTEPRVSVHSFGWMLAITVWLYERTLAGTFARLRSVRDKLEVTVDERTASLRQALEQIEVILNQTNDVIVLADSQGNVQKVNPACQTLLGHKLDHSIEKLLDVIPDPDDVVRCAEALVAVAREAEARRIEARVVCDDGTTIDADIALAAVLQPDNERAGILLSMRDITHLRDLDRFKSRFVANAAHDLSNPLSALKTRLFLLKYAPDQLEQHLTVIDQLTDRMEYLIQDLRALSEVDRRLLSLKLTTFDFAELISNVAETHQPIASQKGVTVSVDSPSTPVMITADQRHCERIVVNLTANAIHYTPAGGKVALRVQADTDYVIFTVQDTGIGIVPEALPHIFERFYRSDRAKNQDATGTGLGLSIVQEMVSAHGGEITVESIEDRGSIFTVTLPLKNSSTEHLNDIHNQK